MILEMKNIVKSFGPVKALKGVSLEVKKGEIHGLLGENGAGKSTLMNVLAGTFFPDEGNIIFDGVHAINLTAKKTQKMGIRFVHQELNIINDLTVYENIFLGDELIGKLGFLDKKSMIKKTGDLLKELNLQIDPMAVVSTLDTSRKQLIEIAKSILFDAKLIIMDEPTTALNNKEIETLFHIMRKLKNRGISIIYISHKMPELFNICDNYTVLRDGNYIAKGSFSDINEKDITELLVGKDISQEKILKESNGQEVLLRVNGLSKKNRFQNISFQLKKGEVLAITGLHGDGRDALAEALYGSEAIDEGLVELNGKKIKFDGIKSLINQGISMVQRNRKERSLIKDLSILNNFSISALVNKDKNLFIDKKSEIERFEKAKNSFSIKIGDKNDYITSLSGGNQQKIMIGRCLELDTEVIILDNPTQGIDVGAKFEIYKIINGLAKQGRGIILFSSEFPEIQKIADRCLVMYKGNLNGELKNEEFQEITIMNYATGAKLKEQKDERTL